VTENDLNQQAISFSGKLYKFSSLTGINRIDAYFHESNCAVAWGSDLYLGPAYSIIGSTFVSISFADSNALSNPDFLPSLLIHHLINLVLIKVDKKVDIGKILSEICTVANLTFYISKITMYWEKAFDIS
tara:strand:+ start:126 stop:515 length:390 start_codon:yes stop_codon:yes gene_type:complete